MKAAKQAGGVVLIVWQHENIPAIADLIRGGDKKDVPQHWPGHTRFDLVWVFDRTTEYGASPRFRSFCFREILDPIPVNN